MQSIGAGLVDKAVGFNTDYFKLRPKEHCLPQQTSF